MLCSLQQVRVLRFSAPWLLGHLLWLCVRALSASGGRLLAEGQSVV